VASRLPSFRRRNGDDVSQRNIEIVIGRLSTDEDFRRGFAEDPEQVLRALLERGTHLSLVEMAALVATDPTLWESVADRIDPRLQKASLKNE
jgi:hypothetical protein